MLLVPGVSWYPGAEFGGHFKLEFAGRVEILSLNNNCSMDPMNEFHVPHLIEKVYSAADPI